MHRPTVLFSLQMITSGSLLLLMPQSLINKLIVQNGMGNKCNIYVFSC